MRYRGLPFSALVGGLFLAACGDGGTGPGDSPPLECSTANVQSLAVGQHVIINPLEAGACVRIPPAGASGAEHLYVPVATEGREFEDGAAAPYAITGSSALTAVSRASRSSPRPAFRALPAVAFHGKLRARERALSLDPAVAQLDRARVSASAPPVVGDQRTFNVINSPDVDGTSIDDFVQATATARFVGRKVAIFVDNEAPANGYTDADLTDVGSLFDDHLYPIDTTAFGRESDIDGNGVVIVLLTHRVNQLSLNCNETQSVIIGYFFGADLLARSNNNPGSNETEVFYGLVPDPNNPDCSITADYARRTLPITFVHEFQHMINFNQHRLVRGGRSEETWLDEGLSHFAEELAGRQVPDTRCPSSDSCLSEFLSPSNLPDAFAYLESPEDFFLVIPRDSTGSLPERGANWLFVRWLIDHFASTPVVGTDLTRQLVETNLVGSENVVARTGVSFSTLVPEWQLTNYLDDLPGFNQPSTRLSYKSWNFRDIAAANVQEFPLIPDSTAGPDYGHVGTLRAGSGKHVRVVQPPGFAAVDLQLSGDPFPSEVAPRIALVRIR